MSLWIQVLFHQRFSQISQIHYVLAITFRNISAYIFYSAWLENLMAEHSDWRDCNYSGEKQKTRYRFCVRYKSTAHIIWLKGLHILDWQAAIQISLSWIEQWNEN